MLTMIFRNKIRHTSFNITPEAIWILNNIVITCSISKSDYIEALLLTRKGKEDPIYKDFGKKGGTQTVMLSQTARKFLEEKAKELKIGMGDYIEILIRAEICTNNLTK